MSRDAAIATVRRAFDSGAFKETLERRIAVPTESQNPARAQALDDYVRKIMTPELERLGFTCRILNAPRAKGPFLVAERIAAPSASSRACAAASSRVRSPTSCARPNAWWRPA